MFIAQAVTMICATASPRSSASPVKGEVIDPWTIIAGVPARYIGPNINGKIKHNQ